MEKINVGIGCVMIGGAFLLNFLYAIADNALMLDLNIIGTLLAIVWSCLVNALYLIVPILVTSYGMKIIYKNTNLVESV